MHEIKHDGYRLIARRDGDAVRLFTCRGCGSVPAPGTRGTISFFGREQLLVQHAPVPYGPRVSFSESKGKEYVSPRVHEIA